jgi:hypothetical protein
MMQVQYGDVTSPGSAAGFASPGSAVGDDGSPMSMSIGSMSAGDVDGQIIEALKSKDRLFVLKLGEDIENLITQRL